MVLILTKLKMCNEIDCLRQGSPYFVNPEPKSVLLKLGCFALVRQEAGFSYFILVICTSTSRKRHSSFSQLIFLVKLLNVKMAMDFSPAYFVCDVNSCSVLN